MEKLNLNQQRDFSDMVSATFAFLKQEFRPFLRCFTVLVLPLMLLFLLVFSDTMGRGLSFSMGNTWDLTNRQDIDVQTMMSVFALVLFNVAISMVALLVSLSYIRVYQDHRREGNEAEVTVSEVFHVMIRKLLPLLLWQFLYFLLIMVGMVFFIVPGIYLAVALTFGLLFIVLKDKSIGDSFSATFQLTRGKWWLTFAFVLILGLIVGVVSNIFQIPFMILGMLFILQIGFKGYLLLMLLPLMVQYFLLSVSSLGLGVMFYSYIEEREHSFLLGKIEEIGSSGDKTE